MVDAAYELGEQQKRRVDPMHHPKIDRLLDRYARKLAENLNQRYAIDGRVPSILIAGGSNFPVRKKHKQNAARDRNMGEYMEIKGLLDKIRSTGMGGISADDTLAVEKLEAKLEGLKAAQESMKAVNAYYRKHKTLEGCPGLSFKDIGELQASMARDWRKDPVPYPAYLLQNNNANIHRVSKIDRDDALNLITHLRSTISQSLQNVNEYASEFANIPIGGRSIFYQQQLLYQSLLKWLDDFEEQFKGS